MRPSPSHPLVIKGLLAEQEARIRASLDKIASGPSRFSRAVGERVIPTELDVFRRAKDGKLQARMVYEISVGEDMLNVGRTMHGGCAVYLIDMHALGLAVINLARRASGISPQD